MTKVKLYNGIIETSRANSPCGWNPPGLFSFSKLNAGRLPGPARAVIVLDFQGMVQASLQGQIMGI
ncbi:hypothetical protein [Pelotomaculum schinkii]|uniref:hypothetical protein n=1 Tax=Pelotomaculum schinkii TaxID=78350 RepID=UPI00167C5A53|nr:hypothetical protein [Pelotomaculum schinkii]